MSGTGERATRSMADIAKVLVELDQITAGAGTETSSEDDTSSNGAISHRTFSLGDSTNGA